MSDEPMPPGLTRRPERTAPTHRNEHVFPCSIDPSEALIVEIEPDGTAAFSMLLGHQWESECASIGADGIERLRAVLESGWVESA